MVVVPVADQDGVDGREVIEGNGRGADTTRTGESDRADALAPDGVGENVQAARELEQKRAVADEGCRDLARFHAGGELRG